MKTTEQVPHCVLLYGGLQLVHSKYYIYLNHDSSYDLTSMMESFIRSMLAIDDFRARSYSLSFLSVTSDTLYSVEMFSCLVAKFSVCLENDTTLCTPWSCGVETWFDLCDEWFDTTLILGFDASSHSSSFCDWLGCRPPFIGLCCLGEKGLLALLRSSDESELFDIDSNCWSDSSMASRLTSPV